MSSLGNRGARRGRGENADCRWITALALRHAYGSLMRKGQRQATCGRIRIGRNGNTGLRYGEPQISQIEHRPPTIGPQMTHDLFHHSGMDTDE